MRLHINAGDELVVKLAGKEPAKVYFVTAATVDLKVTPPFKIDVQYGMFADDADDEEDDNHE